MPRQARTRVIDPSKIQVVHCIHRCVRNTTLLAGHIGNGSKKKSRKKLARDRMRQLCRIFAVDCLTYSVGARRVNVVLRSRPDLARKWSATEVAKRWHMLLVTHAPSNEANTANALSRKEISRFTRDDDNLAEKRARLSDISWWMRRFAEDVARRVNRQDGCRGRVWEGRYKAQPLLDDEATLACLIYVDIWAAQTASVGVTGFRPLTGINEPPRVRQTSGRKTGTSTSFIASREKSVTADSPWLAPLRIGRAHSNSPLAISAEDYRILATWTEKNLKKRPPKLPPAKVKEVLGKLDLGSSDWCDLILNFGSIFKRAAGTPESLREEAKRLRVPALYAPGSPFKNRY